MSHTNNYTYYIDLRRWLHVLYTCYMKVYSIYIDDCVCRIPAIQCTRRPSLGDRRGRSTLFLACESILLIHRCHACVEKVFELHYTLIKKRCWARCSKNSTQISDLTRFMFQYWSKVLENSLAFRHAVWPSRVWVLRTCFFEDDLRTQRLHIQDFKGLSHPERQLIAQHWSMPRSHTCIYVCACMYACMNNWMSVWMYRRMNGLSSTGPRRIAALVEHRLCDIFDTLYYT